MATSRKYLGNVRAENQSQGRWVRSKNAIHWALRTPFQSLSHDLLWIKTNWLVRVWCIIRNWRTYSYSHHSCRYTKGQGEAVLLVKALNIPEVWSQEGADHGTSVDSGIEPGEVFVQLVLLLWKLELLSTKGGHTRLDAASTHGNEEQSNKWHSPRHVRGLILLFTY